MGEFKNSLDLLDNILKRKKTFLTLVLLKVASRVLTLVTNFGRIYLGFEVSREYERPFSKRFSKA